MAPQDVAQKILEVIQQKLASDPDQNTCDEIATLAGSYACLTVGEGAK